MDRSKQIESLRKSLSRFLKFNKDEFGSFTLEDGTKITTSAKDIEVDAEVYQIDDQGNQTPLDDGDYVLQDGRTFTIANNIVSAVTGPEADEDTTETGDDETPTDTDVETSKQKMDTDGLPTTHGDQDPEDKPAMDDPSMDLPSRVEDLEKTVAELTNMVQQLLDGTNVANTAMSKQIKKFSNDLAALGSEPGEEPIKVGKREYEMYDKKSAKNKKKMEEFYELKKSMDARRKMSNNNFI